MLWYENSEMDAVIKFPRRASWSCQGMNSKRLAPRFLSIQRTCNLPLLGKMKIQQRGINFKRNVHKKSWDNNKISATASKRDPNSGPNSSSPSETIDQFYTYVNEKKLQQLGECISQEAYFDDYSFTKPFEGKKEVLHFLEQLTASMGQNVKFRIDHICEGDDFTAVALWHLEWKGVQIPFTRGSSFFTLLKDGEKIIIRRAEVLIESPLKPGSIVLTLLKRVTSLFDEFPGAAEWFLRSPQTLLKWIITIYDTFVAPFLNPLIDGYKTLWNFTARLLSYAFRVVMFIYKILFK